MRTLVPSRRAAEQGGMLIVVAIGVLVVVTAAAFSLSRTSLRELATTGNVYQAARAETASDAGLDWFMAWAGQAASGGAVPADAKSGAVTGVVLTMLERPQLGELKQTWTSDVTAASDPFLLQGLGPDKGYTQAFDLQLEYLGNPSGDASGNKSVGSFSTRQNVWELTSTGQALVKTGSGASDYLRFRAIRAAKLDIR